MVNINTIIGVIHVSTCRGERATITQAMLDWWAQHVGTDSAIYELLKKELYGNAWKERE